MYLKPRKQITSNWITIFNINTLHCGRVNKKLPLKQKLKELMITMQKLKKILKEILHKRKDKYSQEYMENNNSQ
jgi:hypothetical protein